MKLLSVILGLVVMFLGLLPILIQQNIGINYLSVIPSSGNMYQGLIIIAGLIIVVLNFKSDNYRNLRYRR